MPQRLDLVPLAAHACLLQDPDRGVVVEVGGRSDPPQAQPVEGRGQEGAGGGGRDTGALVPRPHDVADQAVGAGRVARLARTVHDV